MADGKRKKSVPDVVNRTDVQQQQTVQLFDEHADYESAFEQSMCFLEDNYDRIWESQISPAWNCAWHNLLHLKRKWLFYQNRASLALPQPAPLGAAAHAPAWDSYALRDKFQRMYAYLERFPAENEVRMLLIKESMIAEWPRTFTPFSDGSDVKPVSVDRAPILRKSVKESETRVRRWHPTVQLSVLALNKRTANVKARFTAHLVTQTSNVVELHQRWNPVGKLLLTQREGEEAIQKDIYSEGDALGTDTGDKRKSAAWQRFCIEIISEIRFSDGTELKNSTLSHPSLIVPLMQNKKALGNIIWDILTAQPGNTNSAPHLRCVQWKNLKLMLKHYVQSQLIEARTLDKRELLHLQCMLFLPLAIRLLKLQPAAKLEEYLFGFIQSNAKKQGIEKIKYRLLREFVHEEIEVNPQQFFMSKCVDLENCATELQHSVWDWLFEAVDMIADRNSSSLLCEDFSPNKLKKDRKSTMMLRLFNDKVITISCKERVWKVFKSLAMYDSQHQKVQPTSAINIRFCESDAGSLCFTYSNLESSSLRPTYGSLSAREIKQVKNGLVGMLMDAPWPAKFEHIVRFNSGEEGKGVVTFPYKKHVFAGYELEAANSQLVRRATDPLEIDPLRGHRQSVTDHHCEMPSSPTAEIDDINEYLEGISSPGSSPSDGNEL